MSKPQETTFSKLFYTGLILIAIESLVLFLSGINRSATGDFLESNGGFFINYIIALVYFIVVLVNHKTVFKFKKINIRYFIITLTLLSISAFTLNNWMVIFAQFSTWMKFYLSIFYVAFIGVCFLNYFPKVIRVSIFFILGLGLIIISYFAIYLAPLYHIAILGAIFLGLSLHLLIPLLVLISLIIIYIKLEKTKIEKFAFVIGIICHLQ